MVGHGVAKNYDKRIKTNRYQILDLSEYTINISFSHLIYIIGTTNRIPPNYYAYAYHEDDVLYANAR